MPDPTLRQITMLGLVPRRPPGRTTHEFQTALSERDFEVDLRTIQRDLDRLSARFPLTYDESRHRRWYWAPRCRMLALWWRISTESRSRLRTRERERWECAT